MGDSETVEEKIEKILVEKVKPFLRIDKGYIELIDVNDGIARIKFTGACFECSLKQMTLRGGVERVIMQGVPGVKRVEEVIED